MDLLINFWAENEIDTRSLTDGIFVALGEVVLETMHMVGLTAWSAFGLGPSLSLVILTDELPVLLVILVGILLKIDVPHGELSRLLDLFFSPLDLIGKKSGLTFGVGFSDSAIGVPGEHVRTLTKWHLL